MPFPFAPLPAPFASLPFDAAFPPGAWPGGKWLDWLSELPLAAPLALGEAFGAALVALPFPACGAGVCGAVICGAGSGVGVGAAASLAGGEAGDAVAGWLVDGSVAGAVAVAAAGGAVVAAVWVSPDVLLVLSGGAACARAGTAKAKTNDAMSPETTSTARCALRLTPHTTVDSSRFSEPNGGCLP